MKIKLSEITHTKSQREHGSIKELKQSIQEVGLICPITINQNRKLMAGRRRFQAIKELGWKEAEFNVLKSSGDLFDFKVAIEENLKRKPLTDLEVASALRDYQIMKNKGEPSYGGDRKSSSKSELETYTVQDIAKDFNISAGSVSQAIQIAKAVEEKPELAKLKGKQILRKIKIEKQKEIIKQLKNPTGLYDVIVLDPPWEFRQEYDPNFARGTGDYPTMSLDKIKKIKLPAKKDCVLWLWVTNNMIKEGFEVLEAFGFTYRNILTWDKEIMGIGAWLRNQTEHCLMATKGHPVMDLTNQTTIIREKRTKHSKKPECFYKLVEKLCIGEKLDYFARQQHKGFDAYGDEV